MLYFSPNHISIFSMNGQTISALRPRIEEIMGPRNVAFVENPNQDLGISTKERLSAWSSLRNVTGNALYAGRLLLRRNGVGTPPHPSFSTSPVRDSNRAHLLVPGYASGNGSFRPLARAVCGVHALPGYMSPRFMEPLTADEAIQHVQGAIGESSADEINLICHSMGGLIALVACDELDETTRDRIGRIVTLGTPWQGSVVAQLFARIKTRDKALRELSPGSDLLERRVGRVRRSTKRKVVSVTSTADKVARWRECILREAGLNVLLRNGQAVTHADLLNDRSVAAMVSAILEDAPQG